MLFDDVLRNPVVKKALAAGEEQAGRVVAKVLSSEAVATGLQGLLTAASTARATLDAGVQTALKAANLPSASEVEALKQKIDELEALIDDLSARLDEPPPRRDPPAEAPGE
jgi:polyhydroxyalkanoate synthesis regulator phasin